MQFDSLFVKRLQALILTIGKWQHVVIYFWLTVRLYITGLPKRIGYQLSCSFFTLILLPNLVYFPSVSIDGRFQVNFQHSFQRKTSNAASNATKSLSSSPNIKNKKLCNLFWKVKNTEVHNCSWSTDTLYCTRVTWNAAIAWRGWCNPKRIV